MFLGVLHAIFLNIANNRPHLQLRIHYIQTVIIRVLLIYLMLVERGLTALVSLVSEHFLKIPGYLGWNKLAPSEQNLPLNRQ